MVAVLVACGILVLFVFVWALCKAAGNADQDAEKWQSKDGKTEDADVSEQVQRKDDFRDS